MCCGCGREIRAIKLVWETEAEQKQQEKREENKGKEVKTRWEKGSSACICLVFGPQG